MPWGNYCCDLDLYKWNSNWDHFLIIKNKYLLYVSPQTHTYTQPHTIVSGKVKTKWQQLQRLRSSSKVCVHMCLCVCVCAHGEHVWIIRDSLCVWSLFSQRKRRNAKRRKDVKPLQPAETVPASDGWPQLPNLLIKLVSWSILRVGRESHRLCSTANSSF